MAITVLYRISSNEVYKISAKGQTFADRNTTYWGVLTAPTFTDGTECKDSNGDLRILGYAKINDAGTVRNATQVEIDGFAAFTLDDRNKAQAVAALDYLKTHPKFRRVMTAFSSILVDEFNILRTIHGLPDRTLLQLKTALENRINKDD